MKLKLFKKSSGFTLIELLIVITIIAALAVAVFVALNPAKRVQDAKNSRRTSDVASILTAIHAYIVDNGGTYPGGLTTGMAETQISDGAIATGCGNIATGGCNVLAATDACVDLATPLASYLKDVPADPSITSPVSPYETNYSVVVDANGIVTVKACGKEGTGPNISASR